MGTAPLRSRLGRPQIGIVALTSGSIIVRASGSIVEVGHGSIGVLASWSIVVLASGSRDGAPMPTRLLRPDSTVEVEPVSWDVVPAVPHHPPAPALARQEAHDPANTAQIQELERAWQGRVQHALQEGYAKGEAAGTKAAAARLDPILQRFTRTIDELAGLRRRCRSDAEEDAVKLSIAVARRILHRELSVDPEAVLGLVHAAFAKLDAREVHRVRLHPEDAALLRPYFEKLENGRKLEVSADPSLERGGAIFETSRGSLDASLTAQLKEIDRGFTDIVRRHNQT